MDFHYYEPNKTLYNSISGRGIPDQFHNHIDYDFFFIRNVYETLDKSSNQEILDYIKDTDFQLIIHPKQLYNLFNNQIKLYLIENKIFVEYKQKLVHIKIFIDKILNMNYDLWKQLNISEKLNNNFTSNKLLYVVFIGSENIGLDLLQRLKNNKNNVEESSFIFCVKKDVDKIIMNFIKLNFDNFIFFTCNEFGNDITPSLLSFDTIVKDYNFEYVIKIHTKNYKPIYEETTKYLLEKSFDDLLKEKRPDCSCIGYSYMNKINDGWNSKLYSKYKYLIKNDTFVPASMFLTTYENFKKVLLFMKENYKYILIQNMYDSNEVNAQHSYVHFIERLFGYVS